MTFLAFLLGLALGIGFWFWQQRRFYQQLRQLLGLLQMDAPSKSKPLVSRLRQEIWRVGKHGEALEKELQTRQQLLEVAPCGYIQVDEENRLLWCNEQARHLLQIDRWEPGQLRLLLELVRSYELDRFIEKTRQRQKPNICEWVFHPPCLDGAAMGKERSLALRAFSWPLPQGQVGVFIENRQPIVELTQSRNQWFGDLAHELRTPLTSIRLVAEALEGRLQPPERRWAQQLLQETSRLIDLVEDWLELSNLEQNPSTSLTYQPVELRSLIHSAWQTLEPLAKPHQLCLNYHGPDTLWIGADEARLTQVFLNLFDNSIKHSPPQSAIRVEVNPLTEALDSEGNTSVEREGLSSPMQGFSNTYSSSSGVWGEYGGIAPTANASPSRRANGTAALTENAQQQPLRGTGTPAENEKAARTSIQIDVIDSGSGFSESDLPHVFERLYRGEPSRQRQASSAIGEASKASNSSGLGLSIVKQIIQAHSGKVKARNHPETGGAWLQINLPNSKPLP